jgi:opacity protein-like surface antigen
MRSLVLAALSLALAAPVAALDGRLDLRAGGGAIVPFGSTTDRFETGWQLAGGVGWKLAHETLVIRFDYAYSRERLVGGALSAGFVNGEHQVHSLEVDLEWTVSPGGPAPVYLLAGPGLYRRQTAITSLRDYAPGPPLCDPWLQVCAPGPVPAQDVLGSRSSTDLGVNLGAGVDIPIRGRVAAFVEIRWRFVWGDTYGLPGESERRSNSHYFPLTLGVRF